MNPQEPILVLTTWPAAQDAQALAETLVTERLAACVSVLPEMESVYLWKGRLERDRERQIVLKTTRGRLEALTARVRSLHPYDVPEWLVIPVTAGSEAYLAWLRASTDSTVEPPQS